MAYEKTNTIPVGVPGAPWPTLARSEKQAGRKTVSSVEMEVLEDANNPMAFLSARSYPEAMGLLYRNMPVPSALPAFEAIIRSSDTDQNNRVTNLMADPGIGKSFLAGLVGKARDPRGPIVTDAGGKNLEYLLHETVFDTEESRPLTLAIDDALEKDKLDYLSLKVLQEKLGKHYVEKGGKRSIDWDGLARDKDISSTQIDEAMRAVRSIERWDANKLGIGFKTKKGPLVLAHEEGRDLLIDEINKAKPGSEAPLQIVWQVLNGETESHTVQLGNSGEFTFRRGNQGTVVCTGNLPKDGSATHLISESFDRRVPAFRVPGFDQQDWQHRICQLLTGLPVSTLHRMQKGSFKTIDGEPRWVIDDPKGFTQLLFTMRTLGMTEDEKKNVPAWQMSEIANWQNVLDVSGRLAEFYHGWSQLVDPESAMLKQANFGDVRTEVDSMDDPTSKITPSTMIRHIEQALIQTPESRDIAASGGFDLNRDWSKPIVTNGSGKEPTELHLGDRLSTRIMDEVYRTAARSGKPNLYKHLTALAEKTGITGSDAKLPELLSVDPSLVRGSSAEAIRLQQLMAAHLREIHPDLKLSDNDEDVLPVHMVQAASLALSSDPFKSELNHSVKAIRVPNTDIDQLDEALFTPVVIENMGTDEFADEARARMQPKKLLRDTTLLMSLAMPATGSDNVKALWNSALTGGSAATDEATAIAQNESKDGLACTTLLCRNGKNDYSKLHVIRNERLNKTLIVGAEKIAPTLDSALKRAGITYVTNDSIGAQTTIQKEFDAIVDVKKMPIMRSAFLLRNSLRPRLAPEDKTLPELLADPSLSRFDLFNFVTNDSPENWAKRVKSGGQDNVGRA